MITITSLRKLHGILAQARLQDYNTKVLRKGFFQTMQPTVWLATSFIIGHFRYIKILSWLRGLGE